MAPEIASRGTCRGTIASQAGELKRKHRAEQKGRRQQQRGGIPGLQARQRPAETSGEDGGRQGGENQQPPRVDDIGDGAGCESDQEHRQFIAARSAEPCGSGSNSTHHPARGGVVHGDADQRERPASQMMEIAISDRQATARRGTQGVRSAGSWRVMRLLSSVRERAVGCGEQRRVLCRRRHRSITGSYGRPQVLALASAVERRSA